MSYILDALRRAEAERERGAVPSLQSQQHSIESEDEAPARSRLLVWAVIALAFALVATLAWTLLGGPGAPPRQIAEGPVTPAPLPVTPAAPGAQSLPEIAAAPIAAPALAPAPAPPPAIMPSAQVAPPKPAPMPMPTLSATTPPARLAPTPAKAAPPVALASPKADAASEPRIYAQSELPDDIRRELPRVAINGSSYSGDAASRMVMINGLVFHEGDQLAAGLVLDKIRRRSAVFAYKGFRYEVMF
jgi:general secretion pathway protein B